jgi:DNA-binding NtrC family response regulator
MSEETNATFQTEDSQDSGQSQRGASYLILATIGDDICSNRARLIPVPKQDILIGRGEKDSLTTRQGSLELRVLDNRMSATHARVFGVSGGVEVEDLNSTNGMRINGIKVSRGLVSPGDVLELGRSFFICSQTEPEDEVTIAAGTALSFMGPTQTYDPRVLSQVVRARRIAPSQVSVLLSGESGTGKEVLAREIHTNSNRKGRLIAVHCGAIPENLLESELFGYKKGAFTGAQTSSEGLVAAADGGTLFLDEIGEMSQSAQVRLLRVLQEREVLPIGETTPKKVDIRLIAATHRDLRALALAGKFRGDLYARLEGVTFHLPKLADRKGDLGGLIAHFLRKFAGENAVKCTPTQTALRALFMYSWPFNIRELEKTIEAAVALSGGAQPIEPKDLPSTVRENIPFVVNKEAAPISPELKKEENSDKTGALPKNARLSPEDEQLKQRLIDALKEHKGNISAVAREWGKARMQIQRWMKRFDLRETREE